MHDVALTVGAAPAGAGLFDLAPQALRDMLTSWNEPAYRTDQVLDWVYRRGADTYDAMSNLPGSLRARLAGSLPVYQSRTLARRVAADGTIKLLLGWPDGATSECVCIPEGDRRTACVSTQVGCPVGCVFCASGLDGLQRQLSCGEIVEQAVRVRQACGAARLSNVVFMGLGEPLHNYDATVAAVRTLNAPWGMGIGARKITISTVGLPKAIRRLAGEGLQIKLAVSLHAPNDELRRRIIPWAESIDIASLIEAARVYFEKTTREVTLEYVLLGGLNDGPEHARELAQVAKGMRSNVNLICYNPVESLPFRRPDTAAAERFMTILRTEGVNTHLRRSRGLDVDAACGQLRRWSAATEAASELTMRAMEGTDGRQPGE